MSRCLSHARSARSARRAVHAAVESLEVRRFLSVGGGFVDGGVRGEYFANTELEGPASFKRSDVRIDFDWGTFSTPGGSISPGFTDVGVDNFSARWAGQIIPKFSETYTIKAIADDGVHVRIKPAGSDTWQTLIEDWAGTGTVSTHVAPADLVAGQKYDIELEYRELNGAASVRLLWASASTPEEVIEPATQLGFNVEGTWPQAFTDLVESSRNSWVGIDNNPAPPTDSFGWPTGDAQYVWMESLNQGLGLDPLTRGKISFSFNGRASLSVNLNYVVGSVTSSYDALANLTTGFFYSKDNNANASNFKFINTDRDGDYGADGLPDKDGITNLKLMKPTAPDAATSFAPNSLFQPQVKDALSRYTVLRTHLNNGNQESTWADRTLPSYFNQDNGRALPRLYSTGSYKNSGPSWEYKIMLANETGRDLYINIPMAATGWSPEDLQSYVVKLANLVKYGSDGVEPYTSAKENPVYPGLNFNLKVYVELSNEYWNFGSDAFRQYWDLDALVNADVNAYLNGGTHPTNDPRARPQDVPIFNYDNKAFTKDGAGNYTNLNLWRKRKMALRSVQISDIFRGVFGDDAINARVRTLYMWQYENANSTTSDALNFVENYFNNGDGIAHVTTPKPVSHYLWGGGGASYYGSADQWGLTGRIVDNSFENVSLPTGYNEAPAGTAWTFSGTAGIARDAGSADDIPPAAQGGGSQMAYVTGTGAVETTFTLPASQTSDTYAISFKSVQRAKLGTSIADTQKFKVFVDGVEVNAKSYSQSGGYQPEAYSASKPWNALVAPWVKSEYYQTLTFTGAAGSTHTVKFVGTKDANQTAFIDDVRLSSVDRIFEAGMPSGGAFANGQTPSGAYADRLKTQAKWAAAYGLNYITYEGGWALGSDTGGSPLQNHAKYNDPRAAEVNASALRMLDSAGGVFHTLGTYAQWPSWSSTAKREGLLDLASVTLMQGQANYFAGLPTGVDNGYALGETLRLTGLQKSLGNSVGTNDLLNGGSWISWNVQASEAGLYNVFAEAAAGGQLQILVDGKIIDTYASANALTRAPAEVVLTRGMHSIRVKSASGSFNVSAITVKKGHAALSGPALAVVELAGTPSTAVTAPADSVVAGVSFGDIVRGPGLRVLTSNIYPDGFVSFAGGNFWGTDLAGSIAKNQYDTFTLTPDAGKAIIASRLAYSTWNQNGRATFATAVRYSTDGVNFTDAPTTKVGTSQWEADLSGQPLLQSVTAPVIFRIYFFGSLAYEANGLGRVSGNDLLFFGSVNPINQAPTIVAEPNTMPAPVSGTSTALTTLGADDAGEAQLTYVWEASPENPAEVTFDTNNSNAAKNTIATFSQAGNYTFLVRAIDAQGLSSDASTVVVTVDQTPAEVTVMPDSAEVLSDGSVQFSAAVVDQFGNAIDAPSLLWTLESGTGSIDTNGLFTASEPAGPVQIKAASGAASATAGITVLPVFVNQPPTIALPASASPVPVAGTSTTLSVLGADDGEESNLSYTWFAAEGNPAAVLFRENATNVAKATVASFTQAGTYTFVVTVSDGTLAATSEVTVLVNQTATGVVVSPSAVTMPTGGTQQFTAVVRDQFGALIPAAIVTWAKQSGNGSISTAGMFTAGSTTGTTVIGANFDTLNGTATLTIVPNQAPTIVTPAAADPTPVIGKTATLTVLGSDDGGESNLKYTWASAAQNPSTVNFSVNGRNAAKTTTATFKKAGTYTFTVTAADASNRTAKSTVVMTVNQTLTSLTVTPSYVSMFVNESRQFTSIAKDQFGLAMSLQPSTTWSMVSGLGTISNTGIYSATWVSGGAKIQAQTGGLTSIASLLVKQQKPAVPTSLVATPVSKSQVNLTWQDNSPNESRFVIQYSRLSDFASGVVSVSAPVNATSLAVTKLLAGKTYYFRLRAENSAGFVSYSAVAQATTPIA